MHRSISLGLAVLPLVYACSGEPSAHYELRPDPSPTPSRTTEPKPPTSEAPAAANTAPTQEQLHGRLEALEALGYVDHVPTPDPRRRGVTLHAETPSTKRVNLYSTRRASNAVLVDMEGHVLHRWQASRDDPSAPLQSWIHVEPLERGEILAISQDYALAKYSWESERLWRRRMRAHHDLAVAPDGRIFVLTRDRSTLSFRGAQLPVLADAVTILSPSGDKRRSIDLLPMMRPHLDPARLRRIKTRLEKGEVDGSRITRPGGVGDVLHANSIQLLQDDIEGVAPAGSWLLSFRAISRVAIVDASFERLLWVFGRGELDGQHDATQLENGNILIFDNGMNRGRSRVVEVDPRSDEIVWSVAPSKLFTRLRGGAQELPNGNILVTESDRGRALEVTRKGDMVWEFLNPDVRHADDVAVRGTIYRLNRFPRAFFQDALGG